MATTLTFNVMGHDVSAGRTLDQVAHKADQTSSKVGGSFKKMGGLLAGALSGAAVTSFLHDSIDEATEAQKVGAQTTAVLKSTGGAADVTATKVGNLATAISNKAGIDDEAIQSGENLLLTFTNIKDEAGKGNDIFSQTTKIMTDMSVATGSDMKSSALQLGKALNDPITGMTKLQKVGVTFTQGQKDQVAALVKTGDTMGAQRVILGELNKEFGGSAAAQATPAEKAQVAWGNLEETLGTQLLPVLGELANFATNDVVPALMATGHWIGQNEAWLKPLVITVGALMLAWKAHSLATDAMAAINAKTATLRSQFGRTAVAAEGAAATVTEAEANETRAVVAGASEQEAALARLNVARERSAAVAAESSAVASRAALGGGAVAGGGAVIAGGRGGMLRGRMGGMGTMALGVGALIGGQYLGNKITGDSAAGTGRNMTGTAVKYAGAGAAIGSMFGPEGLVAGAALGAGAGVLKSYIGGLGRLSAGMQDVSSEDKHAGETIGNFSKAILTGGSALKANEAAAARTALAHTGLASRAAAAGLTEKDLTNAVTGNQEAYDRVVASWRAGGQPSEDSINALAQLREQFGKGTTAAHTYADSHGTAIKAEQRHGSELDLLSGKLGDFTATGVSARQAQTIFGNRVDDVTRSVRANGKTLDANTSFGQKNIAAIRTAATESLAHAQAVYHQTGSLRKADEALRSDREQLLKAAKAAGLNKDQVRKLADAISTIPKNRHSRIIVDDAAARRTVSDFSTWYDGMLANMASHRVPVVPSSQVGNTGTGLLTVPGKHADGGLIKGPGTPTSDSVLMWGSRDEFMVNAKATSQHLPLLMAINNGLPGFRDGGPLDGARVGAAGPSHSGSSMGLSGVAAHRGGHGGAAAMRDGGDTYNVTISLPNAFMTQAEVDRAVASALERSVGRGTTLNISKGIR